MFSIIKTELNALKLSRRKEIMQMSAKNLDSKGRFRSRTIGFRVSPEEEKLINSAVALSGLTKQDYIVKRLLCRDVVVQGNPRVYKALKNQLAEVLSELQRIENSSVSDELLETIRLINTTLNGMKDEENPDVRRKRNDRSERIYWRRYGAVIHKTNY
jgi:hypothetical protein